MMRVKKIFIALSLLTITFFSCQGQPVVPKDFIETTPPKAGTDSWFTLNYSHNEFGVENQRGHLIVRKVKEVHKGELQLSNGKLFGEDHGEWGGSLTFVPTDPTQSKKEIKEGNIKYIFRFKDSIYFIDGIAHGSISRGALYRLDTSDQKFNYTKILDFEDAPEAYTIYGDKILIASHEGFYVVKDFQKEQIVKEAFWTSLYPNSIAAFDDKNIIIGIRSGIVKLNLLTKGITFYKYQK